MKLSVPSLRLHKTGQYFVRIGTQNIYLGKDKKVAHDRYSVEIYKYCSLFPVAETAKSTHIPTVNQVVINWLKDIEKTGRQKNFLEVANYGARVLLKVCKDLPITQVGKKEFRLIKDEFLKTGLRMKTLNERLRALIRFFDWGYDHDMIEDAQYHTISNVRPFCDTDYRAVLKTLFSTHALFRKHLKNKEMQARSLRSQEVFGIAL